MESTYPKTLVISLLLFFGTALAKPPVGTWVKQLNQVPPLHGGTGFVILKTGIFSQHGRVRFTLSGEDAKRVCEENLDAIAWVTHRLSPGEKLSPSVATLIAKSLNVYPYMRCFRGVELNIEPTPSMPKWLEGFLKAFRKELSPKLSVRFAVPPTTFQKLAGPQWKTWEVASVLKWIEGVDFMLYDTGASLASYQFAMKDTFAFATKFLKKNPKKEITFGFPTYHDRTKLHPLAVENLDVVAATLKALPPKDAKIFCHPNVRLAYYAGWTMKKKEILKARDIELWRSNVCQKT